ncbi:MAG: hypothetical protein WBX01_13235 [Nitrososphaeraceae archaeon]
MRNSSNPVFFGIVVALASVLVLTVVSHHALAALSGDLGGFLDLDEAVEAENATMTGATNQTTTNGNMTEVEFLSMQTAQSGSLSNQ